MVHWERIRHNWKDNLTKGATWDEISRARCFRKEGTHAEQILWEQLRNRRLGVKFRRQHPLGPYTVDFYCHEKGLVVEVDGTHHKEGDQQEADVNRTAELERMGLRVIRFRNEEVMERVGVVLSRIEKVLRKEQ